MKNLYVGATKATMLDDRGLIHTAVKQGKTWVLNGKEYDNPFKAFMSVERSVNGYSV